MAAETTHAPNSNQAMVREDEGLVINVDAPAEKLLKSIGKMINDDVEKMKEAASRSVQPPAPCIFEVPDKLRELKASAYTPRAVSIGPLHKDDKHLRKDMEGHKKSYMHRLFRRTRRSDNAIADDVVKATKECVDAMLGMVDKARACYEASPELRGYDDVKFAEMLILDGCFLLELFYKFKMKEFDGGDPTIFSNVLLHLDIVHDLVLLENQIPLFVLEELFDCTLKRIKGNPSSGDDYPSLTTFILDYFANLNIFEAIQMKKKGTSTSDRHILGLLHSCYRPSPPQALPAPQANSKEDEDNIKHSAVELDRAGVNFMPYGRKKTSVTGVVGDYLDLEFNISCWFDRLCGKRAPSEIPMCCCFSWLCQLFGRTRFEIPKLLIFDTTETFLRNLIAFEQCCPGIEQLYITSYAHLMDTLIDSKEDVHLLEKARVIENYLGSGEDVSDLFNNLCKEVELEKNFFFFSQWKQVDDYYNRPWPRRLASLRRNYFSNPWTGISVIAALILFALTVVQTVYSVRSSNEWKLVDDYYNRPWPRSIALLRRNYFGNPWSAISVVAALTLFALTVVQTFYGVRSST
ncbi:hypothetical protein RJ640_018334 [Escallonia rubra]|uniref:Uncharacterized protein n=1 Tax=Escallonia rubra TaxID=112253 RepID=A0AA88R1B5_9ASTE|nr:hypothetical protein RJ640_018334 [Escallonia rubra]